MSARNGGSSMETLDGKLILTFVVVVALLMLSGLITV